MVARAINHGRRYDGLGTVHEASANDPQITCPTTPTAAVCPKNKAISFHKPFILDDTQTITARRYEHPTKPLYSVPVMPSKSAVRRSSILDDWCTVYRKGSDSIQDAPDTRCIPTQEHNRQDGSTSPHH